MKKNKNRKQKAFFSKLEFLMALSDKAFENYLPGKLYLHALCIRKNNRAIYKLILKNTGVVPEELINSFIQLLNHYDIWFTQFKNFRKENRFALKDPFLFYHLDDKSSFPKNAVEEIWSYDIKASLTE